MKILGQYKPPFLPVLDSVAIAEVESQLEKALQMVDDGKVNEGIALWAHSSYRKVEGLPYIWGVELIKRADANENAKPILEASSKSLELACEQFTDLADPFVVSGMANALLATQWLKLAHDWLSLPSLIKYLRLAVASMERAIELNPDYEHSIFDQLNILQGHKEQSDKLLQHWLKHDAFPLELWDGMQNPGSLNSTDAQTWENARDYFELHWMESRSAMAAYGAGLCQLQLATSQADKEGVTKALDWLEKSLAIKPDLAVGYFFQAKCHERQAELLFGEEVRTEGENNQTASMIAHYQQAIHLYNQAGSFSSEILQNIEQEIDKVIERLAILEALQKSSETDPNE